ncbi:MAG: murein biosynthesis integral membrane protein MurJ [Planctomycetes bacterium]|nr:murein biosynthesis integral membrane protein MurJ [Planctomycetota bacterium]
MSAAVSGARPRPRPPTEERPTERPAAVAPRRGLSGAFARGAGGVFALVRRLAGMTLASRALGFVRDVLMATTLGAGACADAFLLAWTLPNLARRIFGEGAFSSALVPVFVDARARGDHDGARRLVGGAVVRLGVALALLTLLLELACAGLRSGPGLAALAALGVAEAGLARADLALDLTQRLLPYLPFVCLAGVLGGALHALGRFAVPALAPCAINAAWIAALLVLGPLVPDPVQQVRLLAAVLSVVGGVELLAHLRDLRRAGVPVAPATPDPAAWARVRRMFGGLLLGAVLFQANALMDSFVAYALVPEGGTSALFYANRLTQLPIGVLGVALATAIFPEVARRAKQGDLTQAGALVDRGVAVAAFVALPAALGLAALAGPLVDLLFRRGAFDAAAAERTARVVLLLAPAVVAACATPVIARGLHAEEEVALPVRVGAACVGLNVVLGLSLVGPLAEAGLALATSVSQTTGLVALAWLARRRRLARGERPAGRETLAAFGRALALSTVMAAAAWGVHAALPGPALARVVAAVLAGAAVYAAGALALRAPEARALLQRGA